MMIFKGGLFPAWRSPRFNCNLLPAVLSTGRARHDDFQSDDVAITRSMTAMLNSATLRQLVPWTRQYSRQSAGQVPVEGSVNTLLLQQALLLCTVGIEH